MFIAQDIRAYSTDRPHTTKAGVKFTQDYWTRIILVSSRSTWPTTCVRHAWTKEKGRADSSQLQHIYKTPRQFRRGPTDQSSKWRKDYKILNGSRGLICWNLKGGILLCIRNYFLCLIDTHFVVNQMRNNTIHGGNIPIAADIKLLFILFPRAHWISMPSVKHRFVFRIILSNQIFKPVGIFCCSGFQIRQESTDLLSPLLRGNGAADSQNQIFFLATFNERHDMF